MPNPKTGTKRRTVTARKIDLNDPLKPLEELEQIFIAETFMPKSIQVLDKNTNRLESIAVGTLKGFPVVVAYAITIHKSQGKSIPHLIVDPHEGMYEKNQAYVALSRATSYKGLRFSKPIFAKDLKYDEHILDRITRTKA